MSLKNIEDLVGDLQPRRPLLAPHWFSVLTLVFGALMVAAMAFLMRNETAVLERLQMADVVGEAAAWVLISGLWFYLAAILARPALGKKAKRVLWFVVGLSSLLLGYEVFRTILIPHEEIQAGVALHGLSCSASALTFAFMMALFSVVSLRRGASVRPKLSGVATAMASMALGNFMISFFCGDRNLLHIAFWHVVLPGAIALSIGAILLRRVYRW